MFCEPSSQTNKKLSKVYCHAITNATEYSSIYLNRDWKIKKQRPKRIFFPLIKHQIIIKIKEMKKGMKNINQ